MYHTVDFLYRDLFHFQAFGFFPISSFTFLEHQNPAITFKFKNCFATETSPTPHQKRDLDPKYGSQYEVKAIREPVQRQMFCR